MRLCRAVGLENVTPHTLRHTFGSVAGDLGHSELTIAALLGHKARTVTQGYVHIDEATPVLNVVDGYSPAGAKKVRGKLVARKIGT